ncbi:MULTISPECIES: hypothetical protein [Nostoc]|uniref:Uncharacterized protein n=2 Tax=Nostoc TaxID=1177 RepID=A0ABR8IDU9_9NOSO|nr:MULTISPECIES: hypothetical protein [Nostoc]MBD2562012.1 hypothetical protein [Nostoc linckia FACHB-391]MBD2648615.1 hypothetical protein [Nostoc foliaceum FACHB-393]
MITQADHRLCAVEAWVKAHQKILELSTGWLIREKDASDDRLARADISSFSLGDRKY